MNSRRSACIDEEFRRISFVRSPKSCLVTVGFGGSGRGTVVASDVASSASELGEGVRKSIASDVLIALILGVDMSSSSTS